MTATPDLSPALAGALVELAGPLSPGERARVLAAAASGACGGGAEVLFTDEDGRIEAVAGSDPGCRRLADLEGDSDGPALACTRTGTGLRIRLDAAPGPVEDAGDGGDRGATGHLDREGTGDGTAHHPPPGDTGAAGPPEPGPVHPAPGLIGVTVMAHAAWTAAARDQGWTLAEVIPLAVGDVVVGGLVLLGGSGWQPTVAQLLWARTLGGVSAAGLLQLRRLAHELRVNEQLHEALHTRIVIEQAKGVLAERGGLDVTTAFGRLRRYARTRRRRISDVAAEVVEGGVADEVLTHTGPLPGGLPRRNAPDGVSPATAPAETAETPAAEGTPSETAPSETAPSDTAAPSQTAPSDTAAPSETVTPQTAPSGTRPPEVTPRATPPETVPGGRAGRGRRPMRRGRRGPGGGG